MFPWPAALFAIFNSRFCLFFGGRLASDFADFGEMLYEFLCDFHVSIFIGCFSTLLGDGCTAHCSLFNFVDVLPEHTAVYWAFVIALSAAPSELVLWNCLAHRALRLPMHAHFFLLNRSGEFGSCAAAGWSFICPAERAQ